MPEVHALLSASSSKQWLNCPPSARLQENFPKIRAEAEAAKKAKEEAAANGTKSRRRKKQQHPESWGRILSENPMPSTRIVCSCRD